MKTRKVTVTFLMAVGLMTILFLVCPRMEVNAKTTITVNSVDQKTAKAVHSRLMKGKEFDIRFPGDENAFYQKFQKLSKKVAKCTDYGIDMLPICMEHSNYLSPFSPFGENNPVRSGRYTALTIKKKHCEEYIYGIKYAEREYKAFKTYINKVLKDTEYLRDSLTNGTAVVDELNYKKTKTVIAEAKQTIKSLKEFKKYLQKTKFRNLSEAMRARIILEIGRNNWSKQAMSQKMDKSDYTLKSLYKRKACGPSHTFATMICKMCAVYQTGEAVCFPYKGIVMTRVKAKNLKSKTRYAILDMGVIDNDYNYYAGCPIAKFAENYYHHSENYSPAPIKKIKKTQRLSCISLIKRQKAVYKIVNGTFWGDDLIIYKFDIPKSEW